MDGRARTVRSRDIERRPRDVPARAGKFSFGPLRRRKLWTLFTLMSRVDLQDIVPFIEVRREMLTLVWDSSNRPILMMRSPAGVDLKSSAEAARQTHAELLRS